MDRTVLATGSARTLGADVEPVEPVEPGDLVVVERPSFNERVARRMGFRPTAGVDEPYLDGLRAVAVILVVVLHSHISAGNPRFAVFGHDISFVAVTGGVGVDLFFILSGFLLARPWFAAELTGSPRPGLKRFWTRRFLRVAPAYYVSIAVVLVFFVPNQIPPASLQGGVGLVNVGSHLLFVHQYVPLASQHFNGANGVYWTLTMEMTFYLLLPFVVPLFTGRRWRITLPAALVATFTWLYLTQNSLGPLVDLMSGSVSPSASPVVGVPNNADYMRALLTTEFPTWLFTFALGIGLARVVVVHAVRPAQPQRWWERTGVAMLALGLGGALLLAAMHQIAPTALDPGLDRIWRVYLKEVPASIAMALIVYGVTFGPAAVRRPLGWLPLRLIGWTSFGIYLYHIPLIEYLDQHTALSTLSPGRMFLATLALVGIIAFGLGLASWLVIERPLLVRGRNRSGRAVAVVASVASVFLVTVVVVANVVPTPAVAVAAAPPPGLPVILAKPLLRAPLAGTEVPLRTTGDATLDQAAERGVMYPIERNLLLGCGSTDVGTTLVLVAPDWSVSGTAFACRDAGATGPVISQLNDWEASRGFTLAPVTDGGRTSVGLVLVDDDEPITPGYPAQLHARYVSGDHVVGLAMQARSPAAGRQGMADLLRSVFEQYPPG